MSLRRSMLFSLGGLINPINLGQPKLWMTGYDNTFLQNTIPADPANGDLLNVFERYNDSSFNPTQITTTNRAQYRELNGKGYIGWENVTAVTGGRYTVGSVSDMSFMHTLNASYTVYMVFKNLQNENHSTKGISLTAASSSDKGYQNLIANTGNNRYFILNTYTGAGTSVFGLNTVYAYDRTVDVPVLLISYRVDLSVGVGNVCARVYKDGILDNSATMSNTPSTGNSTNVLNIGNRVNNDLRMTGYIGDYIIFNGGHDDATHANVCNFLKNKWGII